MCEQQLTSNSTSQQVEEVRPPAVRVGLQISKALLFGFQQLGTPVRSGSSSWTDYLRPATEVLPVVYAPVDVHTRTRAPTRLQCSSAGGEEEGEAACTAFVCMLCAHVCADRALRSIDVALCSHVHVCFTQKSELCLTTV